MLVLMLLPAVVAATLVFYRGGTSRLGRIKIRAWWLIIPAAALHWMSNEGYYPQSVSAVTATRIVTGLSLVLTAVLCWVNWGGRSRGVKVGLGLVFAGTLSNAIPVLVYGGMPYWTSAALISGFSHQELAEPVNGHFPIDSDHSPVLAALSDLVPIPGLMKVISIGDMALLAGLIVVLVGLAGRRSVEPRATTAATPATDSKPDAGYLGRTAVSTSETEGG